MDEDASEAAIADHELNERQRRESEMTPINEIAAALAKAQGEMNHHLEGELLRRLFPKREIGGRQHEKKPLAARLLEGCLFGATDCWHWARALNGLGYGRITYRGRMQVVHRLSYETFVGPIPDGMSVLHRCDNRACINPDHLWVGTYGDNLRDCWAKGRHPGRRARI